MKKILLLSIVMAFITISVFPVSQDLLPREKIPEIPQTIDPDIQKLIKILYTDKWKVALNGLFMYPDMEKSIQALPYVIDRLRDVNPKWKKSYTDAQFPNPGRYIADEVSKFGAKALPAMINGLKDEDPYVRAGVLYTIQLIYKKWYPYPVPQPILKKFAGDVTDAIIPLLKDSDVMVRSRAVSSLGEIKHPSAIQSLIDLLLYDTQIQKDTQSALSKYGKGVVLPMAELLKQNSQDVRCKVIVAKILGEAGDQDAINILLRLLKDNDKSVQKAAAYSLGLLKNPVAVEPLLDVLKQGYSEVCPSVIIALGKIGDTRAVEDLLSVFQQTSDGDGLRNLVVEALSEISDKRAFQVFIKCLGDSDSRTRRYAVIGLGKLKDTEAVEPLINILDDPNRFVRDSAIEALCNMGDPRAIGPVVGKLDQPNMWAPAKHVVKFGGLAVEPLSLVLLNHPKPEVRERSAWILGEIGDRKAVEPLIVSLSDRDETVLISSIEALGKLKDVRATAPLIEKLKNEWRLSITDKIITSLEHIGEKAVPQLIDALKSDDAKVRKNVATALGRIMDPSAVEPLIELLDDENKDVGNAAVRALGSITGYAMKERQAWEKEWPKIKEGVLRKWENSREKK
ncbi:MAG TPA: HEAT repeat domain-containing protein [bacterium]|nr:HEAT repeat domain-containing protein [bacterium]